VPRSFAVSVSVVSAAQRGRSSAPAWVGNTTNRSPDRLTEKQIISAALAGRLDRRNQIAAPHAVGAVSPSGPTRMGRSRLSRLAPLGWNDAYIGCAEALQ